MLQTKQHASKGEIPHLIQKSYTQINTHICVYKTNKFLINQRR
jgi:hypothetical protein